MKKRHISICALLSCVLLQTYASSVVTDDCVAVTMAESRGAKTDRILAGVKRVVEGLIKVIRDPHNKQSVLLHVGDMLSGIFSIAASSLPSHELSQEEVAELRSLLQDVAQSLVPLLHNDVTESAASLREYLQTVPLENLNQLTEENISTNSSENAAIDDNEKELHANLLNSLNNLVQSLFAVVQYPENPRVIEQSIADMFSNIINVASQTLKYEYLSSKDAEDNVVSYLDSFSNELTQEIKHLMLQTALHLRGSRACGSCNNCCSNSCSSCPSTICRPCCRPCNNCCRNIDIENQVRGCCGCSSCNCSSSSTSCCGCCSSCSSNCSSNVNRKCSTCGSTNSCNCNKRVESSSRKCSTCGCPTNNCNSCNNCGGRTVAVDSQNPTVRGCTLCGNSNTNGCPNCGCKNTFRQQVSLRKCSSCSCSTNNGTCNTCGCQTVSQRTLMRYAKSGNNRIDATEVRSKCGCNNNKPKTQEVTRNDNMCSKCGCSNKPNRPGEVARCGCNNNKPRALTRSDTICLKCGCFNKPNRPGGEARCGCSQPPRPQQEITRNEDICSKCGCSNKPNRPGEARCGCNKPKPQ